MGKVKLANIGIVFDSEKLPATRSLNLFEGSKILSITADDDNNQPTLWIHFMYPPENEAKTTHQQFNFIISDYCKSEVEIDSYDYIDDVNFNGNNLAVFCNVSNTMPDV